MIAAIIITILALNAVIASLRIDRLKAEVVRTQGIIDHNARALLGVQRLLEGKRDDEFDALFDGKHLQ